MNKRVLEAMIRLVWAFLIAFKIISLGFKDWFVIKVTNEKFLRMGEYLDTHAWLGNVVCYLCSLVTYFLYFGAVCKTWVLPKKHALIALATATIAELLEVILPSVGCYLGTAIMILLPYIFGADYRQVAIVFTLHYVGQLLLLNIRQLPMFLIGTKLATQLVLLIDNYLWLLLLYMYANKYKGDFKWGKYRHRSSEKTCSTNSLTEK